MHPLELELESPRTSLHRRTFLRRALMGSAALFTIPGAFAEQLVLTPRQTEGPYYPDKLPLDTDNDLIIINSGITPGVGEITHLHGVVTDGSGAPVPGALVEIWQTDSHGSYIHSQGGNRDADNQKDPNFQGYGRFLTDRQGRYYFRTIKPVTYPGRTPHIHCIVSQASKRMLTTQCYIKGHPQNERDGILRGIRDDVARESVLLDWTPIPDSKIGEFSARWDIRIGLTPEDPAADGFGRRPPGGPGRPPGSQR